MTRFPDGFPRRTSILTVTSLDHHDIKATADVAFRYVDEFHVTFISPQIELNVPIEISKEETRRAWEGIYETIHAYNRDGEEKVFLKMYRINDLAKLASVVGEQRMWNAFTRTTDSENDVEFHQGALAFTIDNVRIAFFPTSIWLQESFLIDADGAYRTAYSQKYTLEELNSKRRELQKYTVARLRSSENFEELYHRAV